MRPPALRVEQGPPLAVPTLFFLAAPLAVVAAGLLLVVQGEGALASRWTPTAIALVHLGTLGLLGTTMLGALYQMTPVVAGAVVPLPRLAHAVLAAVAVGTAALAGGFVLGSAVALKLAVGSITLALGLFLVPVAHALRKAPVRTDTVAGMRLAVLALAVTAVLGGVMAWGHATGRLPVPRDAWVRVHLGVGLLGWVGGLVTAVSWQILPMFYYAPPIGTAWRRAVRWGVAVGVGLPVVGLVVGVHSAWLLAPAVVAVWIVHPAAAARSLWRRPPRRADGSLAYWWLALGVAPALAVLVAWSGAASAPPWVPVLFGWIALWGWAGALVHGMLTRIVPFLVWFHRFSPLAGKVPVPPMRRLLPDRWTRAGFGLHTAALLAGAAAIVTGEPALARLAGGLLLASGVELFLAVAHVLRQAPDLSGAPPEEAGSPGAPADPPAPGRAPSPR